MGIPATLGPLLVPRMLPRLQTAFPRLRLHVKEDGTGWLVKDMESGAYDFLILPRSRDEHGWHREELFKEAVYVAFCRDHPLAARASCTVCRPQGQRLLTPGPSCHLHEIALEICEAWGSEVRLDYNGQSLATLLRIRRAHEQRCPGTGQFAAEAMKAHQRIELRKLCEPGIERGIAMIWRAQAPEASAYRQLAAVLAAEFANIHDRVLAQVADHLRPAS